MLQSTNLKNADFGKLKTIGTILSALFIGTVLLWEHLHGGIPSHHFLHQKELPAISNAWGALLLPILAWVLLGRVEIRLRSKKVNAPTIRKSWLLFCSGLLFGTCLAISFTHNFEPFLDNVLLLLILLGLLIPIYFSEFILGFVLAMTITFGVLLPTLFMLIFAVVGFILYRYIRPQGIRIAKLFRKIAN